jgi:hypothetical protein
MTKKSARWLYWAPRVLSILFIAFVSIFALDEIGGHGLWQTVIGLTVHLIPSFVLVFALILAWRWEWIGAVLYAAAGMFHVVWASEHLLRPLIPILTIAGPAVVISALFLVNWLKRGEIRARNS